MRVGEGEWSELFVVGKFVVDFPWVVGVAEGVVKEFPLSSSNLGFEGRSSFEKIGFEFWGVRVGS